MLAILREANGSYIAKANGEPHILQVEGPSPILCVPTLPDGCRTFVNTGLWHALFDGHLLYEGKALIYLEPPPCGGGVR